MTSNSRRLSLPTWRKALRGYGFRALGTGGRRGIYVGREAGPMRQAIGVLVAPARDDAFNIQLNVNMPLPGTDPPHDVVILESDVAPQGVRIQEPGVHDPNRIHWWPPDDAPAAWKTLVDSALPWLDRFSTPAPIIEYFEAALGPTAASDRRSGGWRQALRRLGGAAVRARPAPHHQYLLFLSILYEANGQRDLARDRLEAYTREVADRGIRAELQRLGRHRRALGMDDAP